MRFFATCAKGTEGALRRELSALRLHGVRGDRGGVAFEGELPAGFAACLHARTAMRVLLELARFPAPDAAALYDGARAVEWTRWLTARTTLAVEATVRDSAITHSGFVALKVKDAAVDAVRDALGERPDVDAKDPDVRIVLHLARDEAALSLDLAGEPLHRRAYRAVMTPAPLKETLAAAVLALGGVSHERPFLDPMCGSGTLAIEHALAARRIPPGLGRAFGFQRWPAYRGALQSTWDRMKEAARAEALPAAPAPILARDLSAKAIDAARRNAAAAGVGGDVRFEVGDAREIAPGELGGAGTLCMNPPYGERLMGTGSGEHGSTPLPSPPPARGGRETSRRTRPTPDHRDRRAEHVARLKLEGLYRGLAEAVGRFHGWDAVFLSGSPLLEQAMRARAEVTHRLWNGPLEVRLLRYHVR
jgi:23S rRNA G2445 N2-methylase RlmL